MVCKGEVSFIDPNSGNARGALSGQGVLVPIIDQIDHVKREAINLSHRRPDQIGKIERHRNIAHNAMVFSGTRIPVRAVERFLAAGYGISDILREYPSLQTDDVEVVARAMGNPVAA
jgi:uncharacterized protein (DUF433 family)